MDQRLERLQELIDSQQSAFNKAAIGTTVDVLFERPARKDGQIVGRTAYLQPAHVMASPDIIGQVLPVTHRQPRALQPARRARSTPLSQYRASQPVRSRNATGA